MNPRDSLCRAPLWFRAISVCMLTLGLVAGVVTAAPDRIAYQGELSDSGGAPINAALTMTFRLYNVASGGTELWSESQNVQVTNGVFNVELGAVTPLPIDAFRQDSLFLGVQVDADDEMVPRQRLNAAAYALNSPVGQFPVPLGTILPWAKDLTGVPSLPEGWLECDGQVVADSESPLDGTTLPDLNGSQLALRGDTSSGTVDNGHQHGFSTGSENASPRVAYNTGNFGSHTHSGTTQPGMSTYAVVYIIKVK